MFVCLFGNVYLISFNSKQIWVLIEDYLHIHAFHGWNYICVQYFAIRKKKSRGCADTSIHPCRNNWVSIKRMTVGLNQVNIHQKCLFVICWLSVECVSQCTFHSHHPLPPQRTSNLTLTLESSLTQRSLSCWEKTVSSQMLCKSGTNKTKIRHTCCW